MREEDLADAARRELCAGVAHDADADDRDIEIVAVDLGDAPDRALRDAAFAEDAIDARDDLGAVRERHGPRVELLEVANAKIHERKRTRAARILKTRGSRRR